MPDLALLNEELKQNIERREALRKRHPGKKLPEGEDRVEWETLSGRSSALIDLIEVEKLRREDAELAKQRAYFDEPQRSIPVGFEGNAERDDVKRLLKAGWENKNGILHAPTASGKMVAMCPEDVLFGPLPEGAKQAEIRSYFTQTRAVYREEYGKAWRNWIKNFPQGPATAYSMLDREEQKALSEGLDTAGGYTVPPDVQSELGGRRGQTAVMRSLATVRQTVRDSWEMPMVAPNTTSGMRNIYTDGFVGSWVGEVPGTSDTDPAFQLFQIQVKKVRAKTTLSNDLIADSVASLLSELATRGGRTTALVEDQGFISGDGIGSEPLGILSHSLALTAVSSDGMAMDVEGTTANSISNTTSDAGSAPEIKALAYALPSQYAENGTWLMRRGIQGDIAALVDGNGRPFWNSYLESGFGRPVMQIEGMPVRNSEFMGTDGSVSVGPATIPLLLADFREFYIIERSGFSVRILNERYADTDQTGLVIFSRVGGGLWNYDAFRTGIITS